MNDSAEKGASSNDSLRDYRVVMPQHLNQYGVLFGGYLLQVIDELAFITCARRFPDRNFVTRALNNVEFHASAHLGDVLETTTTITSVGSSSVRVHVQVFVDETRQQGERRQTFDGEVVLVCVDGSGRPRPVLDGDKKNTPEK